ncbi:hypothetical protein HDU87_000839 [Geranomyces variabilis]|uniref:Uncharacterized protein n=1 Tax=Geranomyces variabilis TaxID=109894 RepID=A0AAD5TBU1_9FUNG|nr:hypothetical protein HDU87_000839 [Geranomyces variabilis]
MTGQLPADASATEADAVLTARLAAGVTVSAAGRPFAAASVDLIEDVLGDREYESALRILESFISPTAYPPPYLLDKLLSIPLGPPHHNKRKQQQQQQQQKQPSPPFQTQIHAVAVLNLVFTLHGSEPFRTLFIEQEAAESRLWELMRQACGFWEETEGKDKEVQEKGELEHGMELVLAGPMIRFLLDVVGHDLAVQYRAGNVKKSILATSLGRYRKVDFRAPLDVMSEMVESSALESDAIPLVAALIYELALLSMAGNSDLTSYLRDLLPNLKAFTPDDLQELLSCLPSNSLRWTLTDMLLRNFCTFAKKPSALQCSSSAPVLDPAVIFAILTATPLNKDDWTTVTLLVTQLVSAVDVGGIGDEEERHQVLRDAVRAFLVRAPKRYLDVAVARALEDAMEIIFLKCGEPPK